MNSIIPCHRVSAGPYTLELPPNGVAILYEADPSGGTGISQVPGVVGYLEALVQFAGEVIRLRAMLDAMRLPSDEVQPMMGIPPEGWKP